MYEIKILAGATIQKTLHTKSLIVAIMHVCMLNKEGYAVSLKRVKNAHDK